MRILIFTPSFGDAIKSGGPARSISNLVSETSIDDEVSVVTSDRDLGDTEPMHRTSVRRTRVDGAIVYRVNPRSLMLWIDVYRTLAKENYDLVLINSIWNIPYSAVPAFARVLGILQTRLFVAMPRGELDPGALTLRHRKKVIGGPLARRLYRTAVTHFAATSEVEAGQLRSWFPGTPVLAVRNTPDSIVAKHTGNDLNRFQLLFLGRIHPKKGLLELLESLRRVDQRSAFKVRIGGPVEDRPYWDKCLRAIDLLPDHVDIEILGPIPRDAVPALYWTSDLFVALTLGENFGHTIAESLQAGCPVLVTPTTPWTELIRQGGGVVVEDRADSAEVARKLDDLAELTPTSRTALRRTASQAFASWAAQQAPSVIEAAQHL